MELVINADTTHNTSRGLMLMVLQESDMLNSLQPFTNLYLLHVKPNNRFERDAPPKSRLRAPQAARYRESQLSLSGASQWIMTG